MADNSSNTLDPILAALQSRLTAAITDGALTLNATNLGAEGGDLIVLFQDTLATDAIDVSGTVTLSTTVTPYLKLYANSLDTAVLSASQNPVVIFFGVASGALTMQLATGASGAWLFASAYPQLASFWPGTVAMVTGHEDDVGIILASQAGPQINGPTDDPVEKGLNISGQLSLGGADDPAHNFHSLVSGLSPNLAVRGPTSSSTTFESITLLGDLPDFSVTLPLINAISFTQVKAGLIAKTGAQPVPDNQLATDVYDASLRAQAEIGFGGPTLPLMMELPYTKTGVWRFGMIPDKTVSVAHLSGFFGSFTGLDLLAALPDSMQTLTKFELRNFMLTLNSDFSDYQTLALEFGTPADAATDSSWTIIAGATPHDPPLLQLSDLTFAMNIDNQSGTPKNTGHIGGAVAIADTLNVEASVALPFGTGPFLISVSSLQPLPNLADVAKFLGGRSLGDLIPDSLATLTSFNLSDLTLIYDMSAKKIDKFSIGISTAQEWVIVQDWLSIKSIQLNAEVVDPMASTSELTGSLIGVIGLGTAAELMVLVAKSAPGANWLLSVTSDEIDLPTLADLTTLAGGDITPLIPDSLASAQFTLSQVEITADVSAAKMQKFHFALSTHTTWTIIEDVLAVTAVGVFLDLDWKDQAGTRETSGAIWGDVTFCGADFWLQAAYGNSQWTLSVKLEEDSSLELKNLVDAFDTSLWTTISGLGIPNVTLLSAEIDYTTGGGDYAFSGAIGPSDDSKWEIPLGITSINIEKIGADVTCTRGQDGKADNKVVKLTGAFSIGAVRFDTSYAAGGPVTVECSLIGDVPVSAYDLVQSMCASESDTVTWASGFTSLQDITFSNVSAKLVLGTEWSFQLSGKVMISDVEVDCLFLVQKIKSKWEFALAIKVQTDWNLPGFTDVFDVFNFDKQTWMVVGSSFTSNDFHLPATFNAPTINRIGRGLDFYASLETSKNANKSVAAVPAILPSGEVAPSLVVHGLLADPLTDSFVEIAFVAPAEGWPIFGCDDIRLAEFDLLLRATPAVVLRGDFIFKAIKNPDNSFFHLIVDLMVSPSEVRIDFEQQPNLGAIFEWQDAFGLSGLDVKLLKLGLGIGWEPPAIDGTFAGEVDFEHDTSDSLTSGGQTGLPRNTVRPNEKPSQKSVARAEVHRSARMLAEPHNAVALAALDLTQAIDPDKMKFMMGTSILFVPDPPVPYPYMLEGDLVNLTLPYILKRFLDISIPPLLSPINFPLIKFHIELPNPEQPGSMDNLKFDFDGVIEIFFLHGEIKAAFDPTHIMFSVSMDPLIFKLG